MYWFFASSLPDLSNNSPLISFDTTHLSFSIAKLPMYAVQVKQQTNFKCALRIREEHFLTQVCFTQYSNSLHTNERLLIVLCPKPHPHKTAQYG